MRILSRLSCLKGEFHHLALALGLWIFACEVSFGWVPFLCHMGWLLWTKRAVLIAVIVLLSFYHAGRLVDTRGPVSPLDAVRVVYVEPSRNRFVGSVNRAKILVYYETGLDRVKAGDTVAVMGVLSKPTAPSMPGDFDYPRYLKARNVVGVVIADEVTVLKSDFSIYRLREMTEARLMRFAPLSRAYLSTFLLADRAQFDPDFLVEVGRLGVAHLFAVSGLHVATLTLAMDKGLTTLSVRRQYVDVLLVGILAMYMVLALFAASVVRASLMAIMLMFNRRFKAGFTAVDVVAVLFAVLLLIRPYYYVETGFVLTFSVTFTLLLGRNFLDQKSRLKQALIISLLAFFASLPLVSGFHFGVNLWTPLLNIVFIFYTTVFLLPLTYLVFIFPWLEPLHAGVATGFEMMVQTSKWLFPTHIRLWIEPGWPRFIYAVLFVWLLAVWHRPTRKILGVCLGLFLLLIYVRPWLQFNQELWFFHVHGDSALLRDRFNRCNILIDTGTADSHARLARTLQTLHITHLDYVFISHMHADHMGAFEQVAEAVTIKQVISNQNSHLYAEQWFDCGAMKIYLHALESAPQGENNRSLVMRVIIGAEMVLFTGDIEGERERSLHVHDLAATILKVPHHGSNTSSSLAFIAAVNPDIAIISAHQNNPFNHPDEAVIERLETFGIRIYRTDLHGSILVRIRQEQRAIITD